MEMTAVDGLFVGAIVGGIQILIKAIDWVGKKYFDYHSKKHEVDESAISRIDREILNVGNSLLQIRNEFAQLQSATKSNRTAIENVAEDLADTQVDVRNIQEALRKIDTDHFSQHHIDLKITDLITPFIRKKK